LAFLLAAAQAEAVAIAFSGSGTVAGGPQVVPVLSGLTLSSATSNYTVNGGQSGWHVDKLFDFNVASLVGFGTFTLANGADSFSGTFTSSKANAAAPTDLFYSVNSGTGTFAGWVGSGTSSGITEGNAFGLPAALVTFTETGSFNLTPIPEPATVLLLAVGLAGTALRLRRR
jgi:hypothetical protein